MQENFSIEDKRTIRSGGIFDTREELILEVKRMSDLNMTKTAIAAACHVSTTTVWRIMNGDHGAYVKPRVSAHSNDEAYGLELNKHWVVPDTSHLTEDDRDPGQPFTNIGSMYATLHTSGEPQQ